MAVVELDDNEKDNATRTKIRTTSLSGPSLPGNVAASRRRNSSERHSYIEFVRRNWRSFPYASLESENPMISAALHVNIMAHRPYLS